MRRLPLAVGGDAVLAVIILGVVTLMVVPLPTFVLDVLLASNLAVSIAILLVTLNVTNALRIATFPTVLLLTTLVRLALNVATTRLVLSQADAGEIIRAFGEFVVGGNYVVGGVVFLALCIIQYVVVARGSERVAEVGARFTLDAMPGKQLAIDAELRAGTLGVDEARRRRRELERENHFYGAMDGAMKFVKGDVIASFAIVGINLIGGLAIGIGQRGMAPADALRRYGLLTIGDGLSMQIPALLLATAAGILVTRVASDEATTALGDELAMELLRSPRALGTSSVFLVVLAAVPGLPALPFLVIGGLLLALSFGRSRALAREGVRALDEPAARRDRVPFVPVVVPWSIAFGAKTADAARQRRAGVEAGVDLLRHSVFRDLGVPLPACQVRRSSELADGALALSIFELPTTSVQIDGAAADQVASEVAAAFAAPIRARAADFIGVAETQALLDGLERVSPALVRELVPKPVDVPLLSEVLRRLVDEGVSVRDLRAILEAVASNAKTEKDPLSLAEHARAALKRAITYELTGGASEISVYLLDAIIEDTLADAVEKTAAGDFLALSPAASRDVVRAIEHSVGADPHPVLVTRPEVRRHLKKLIGPKMPQVRVVSYAELLPETSVRVLGRAKLVGLSED